MVMLLTLQEKVLVKLELLVVHLLLVMEIVLKMLMNYMQLIY